MTNFLEIEEKKKTVNSMNLDDFSVEDLKKYINQLEVEINRAKDEILKKNNLLNEAEKFFK